MVTAAVMPNSQAESFHCERRGALPKWIRPILNMQDVKTIEDAIARAEAKTKGEIVTVIVRRTVDLKPPTFKLIAVSALIFYVLYQVVFQQFAGDFLDDGYALAYIPCAILALAVVSGFYLSRSAYVRRGLMPDRDADQLAKMRAELEFFRAGIGGTKSHTGVLLFLAVEERHAVVLGDQAITAKLPTGIWADVLSQMTIGLKSNSCAKGLEAAIATCGRVLAEHFPAESHDVVELPNTLIIRD